MAEPRVSIVVPYRDAAPYMAEAIASVQQQSFRDWELLLVDDGSSDGSERIAGSAAAADDRIRALHHEGGQRRGVSASRNLGIIEARSPLIAQMDADDVILADHVARHEAALRQNPGAALVYGQVERWYSWSGAAADLTRDFVARPLGTYDRWIEPPELLPIILQRPFGVPLGFVARREAILEVGGYDEDFPDMYDDQVFLAKFGLRHRAFAIDSCTYRYRRHRDSLVWRSNAEGMKLVYRARFLAWLKGYLQQHGVTDRSVWRAVRQEQWKCRHPRLAAARARAADIRQRGIRKMIRIWSDATRGGASNVVDGSDAS